jgi:hypothetical protein
VKRFAFVSLAFLLAGCLEQQGAQLAKCKLETLSAGIDPDTVDWVGVDPRRRGEGAQRMTLCMRAGGYEMDAGPAMCQPEPERPMWLNAACYAPADPFSKWLWQLELRFRFGEKGK